MSKALSFSSLCLCIFMCLLGCGGAKGSSQTSISIQPKPSELGLAQPQAFVAVVSGMDATRLGWKTDLGTILQANGSTMAFQAPETPGIATITVYSLDDPNVGDKAIIRITKPNGVVLSASPVNISLYPLQASELAVTAVGTYLQKFNWSVDDGSVQILSSSSIRWTAPPVPGKYGITARWLADSSVVQTIPAEVLGPPLVLILTPSQATISINQIATLYLQISTNEMNGVDTSASWSTDGGVLTVGNGGQAFFSSSFSGTYHVIVKSNSYPTVQSTSVIAVQ